ncbi:MlaD family protein [Patulibacter brassicae]|uniref:MlaD family protein n=1 Tax=Patulibacter brassicae TaxID=1705717 RepID=A0ABU4VPJ7_9ACTN|nr:MlaD family protein [Patulibacter brassicae]MDX8153778.1 MlaD family protein [Patulibacter brassicae]
MAPSPTTRRRRLPLRVEVLLTIAGLLAGLAAVYVSFTANTGLPLVPAYDLRVEVPDANRMIKNNQVRIGGVRVGQVADVEAQPARAGAAPRTVLSLKLDSDVPHLPVDTTVRIRPVSVLGATYLDVVPGRSARRIAPGGTLAASRSRSTVELTDLLDLFDPRTSRGLQRSITNVAAATAGRGAALGEGIERLGRAAGPLTAVARALSAESTRLGGLLAGYARTMEAVGSSAEELGSLVDGGARTFRAVASAREDLGRTLEELPPTAEVTTRSLARLRPGLDGLAAISVDLLPASRLLPAALRETSETFRRGTGAARKLPRLTSALTTALRSARTFAALPQTDGSLRKVDELFAAVGELMDRVAPAQIHCNTFSLWGQNFYEAFGFSGNGRGPSTGVAYIKALGSNPIELLQNREQHDNLHVNYLPRQNAQECEAGNEPFQFGRKSLASPPGNQSRNTIATYPPAGVIEHARRAGLLDRPPGDRP